jgi:hypothetical protein
MDENDSDRLPLALFVLLGLFLAAGIAAAPYVPAQPPSAATLPDLSGASIVEIRDASGRTVLSGEFRTRTDPLGNEEKDAALSDRKGQRVVGEVEIEIPGPEATNREQELEIDIIRIAPDGKFALFIDDREILTFMSDDRGSVDVEITSDSPLTPGPQPAAAR